MNNHVEHKQWPGEAAGVGTWGRTFQGWVLALLGAPEVVQREAVLG